MPDSEPDVMYADTATGISFALTKTRLTRHFTTAQRLADPTAGGERPGRVSRRCLRAPP
ncbi:hypothetical protein [Streptomyces sp. NRRL WC-3626]|uniref:hypothetical protein n=1 Tax=Streptomyces sp. NRRL WC-3626 TaxID=1463926 RepID=UPI000A4F890B|nr:hypothetical protein [Streptomyces sp. NRRL WC-3626]